MSGKVFYIVRNGETGEVLGQRLRNGGYNPSTGNCELAAKGSPPRLYLSKTGARASLRSWLAGRVGRVSSGYSTSGNASCIFGGGRDSMSMADAQALGAKVKGGYVHVPVPARTAMAADMEIVPVKLALGD